MSIEGFESQVRWVKNSLDSLESIIENDGEIEDAIAELGDLKGQVKDLISEAEEIIEGINNL